MKTTSDLGHRTSDALLEIGSEELPASFIAIGMKQLKALAEESLKASGLTFSSIETHGTPRRLAVLIHGLPDRSPDQKKVVTGPPSAISKDAQGQWTPAALGFARKQGLKPSDLTIEKDRLSATVHIKGVATKQLLADLFPQWITRLEFPKSMVWEPTKFRYPRPLRWIAALYGTDLVSFSLAGVRSARWTLGLGPSAPKKIILTHASKYAILLKNQCVLVDSTSRQDAIRRYAEQAVKRVHGKVHMSTALLEQVSNLVEHPVAILGNFDQAYLDLPKEVLITCLEHHQKYFPVMAPHPNPLPKGEGAEGTGEAKLLPHFIGIRNGMSVHQEIVREGYERVLAARLADARFFFNQDRRTTLAAKVDALKGVMFQEKLGNLFDKKERVKKLLDIFSSAMGGFAELEKAKRVADLCKADLVTDMVREFPELQGIMARLYAHADGEEAIVSKALEEHYWPITLTSTLPETPSAALVALADKLDTLAGDFWVGLIPTGSADPYGLRRAAVGVLRILEAFKWNFDINYLIDRALSVQPGYVVPKKAGELHPVYLKLTEFMAQRWHAWMAERGLCRIDEAQAVRLMNVSESIRIVAAMKEFRADPVFSDFVLLFKRANQLWKKTGWLLPEPGPWKGRWDSFPQEGLEANLLVDDTEKKLWDISIDIQDAVEKKAQEQDYLGAMKEIVRFKEPVDRFFEKVMVMVEDEKLRTARLKLLGKVIFTATSIADFSKLQNA